jgi:hypothetical protein
MNGHRYWGWIVMPVIILAGTQCTREINYAEVALAHSRFTWDSITAPGFTLYTKRGGYGAARGMQYRDEVRSAIAHALAMLGAALCRKCEGFRRGITRGRGGSYWQRYERLGRSRRQKCRRRRESRVQTRVSP